MKKNKFRNLRLWAVMILYICLYGLEINAQLSLPKDHSPAKKASFYDFVVIGTVINIKGTPGPETEMFHTEVVVGIDSTLKGNINHTIIFIRLESGPISDDGKIAIIVSEEARFEMGEQVVLFLNKLTKDSYINSPYAKRHKSFNGKKSIEELPDDNFYTNGAQVFKIEKGIVYYLDTPMAKNKFIKSIIERQ